MFTLTPCAVQRAHRRDPFGRRRDLDHDVGPPDQVRQAQPLGDGLLGVGGKLGQHLQRDAPVDAARRLEDRQHHVAAAADVVEHELLVDRLRGLPIGDQALQLVLVVGGAGDRLLEDRRVRRHAAHALVAERAQPAGADQAAADVVVPDALAELVGRGEDRVRRPDAVALFPCPRPRPSHPSTSSPSELLLSSWESSSLAVCLPGCPWGRHITAAGSSVCRRGKRQSGLPGAPPTGRGAYDPGSLAAMADSGAPAGAATGPLPAPAPCSSGISGSGRS